MQLAQGDPRRAIAAPGRVSVRGEIVLPIAPPLRA